MSKFTDVRIESKTIECCVCKGHPAQGFTVFKESSDGKWYCRAHKPTKISSSLDELCSLIEGRKQK